MRSQPAKHGEPARGDRYASYNVLFQRKIAIPEVVRASAPAATVAVVDEDDAVPEAPDAIESTSNWNWLDVLAPGQRSALSARRCAKGLFPRGWTHLDGQTISAWSILICHDRRVGSGRLQNILHAGMVIS